MRLTEGGQDLVLTSAGEPHPIKLGVPALAVHSVSIPSPKLPRPRSASSVNSMAKIIVTFDTELFVAVEPFVRDRSRVSGPVGQTLFEFVIACVSRIFG